MQSTTCVPLVAVAHVRKLLAFSNVLVSLAPISSGWMDRIAHILESRVNKEVTLISGKRSAEVMKWIVFSLLEVLCDWHLGRMNGARIIALLADYLVNAQWKIPAGHSIQKMVFSSYLD